MAAPIAVIPSYALKPADPKPGMARAKAFGSEVLWAGRAVTEPGAGSGWHHLRSSS